MSIHVKVAATGSELAFRYGSPGWWVAADVVIETSRHYSPSPYADERPTPITTYRSDTHSPPSIWQDQELHHTYDFLVDTGSDVSQLGSQIVDDLAIKLEETTPAEGNVKQADGSEKEYQVIRGQLWIRHANPILPVILRQTTYSAFDLKFYIPKEILLPPDPAKEAVVADSVVGLDVVDFLLTYGDLFRLKPTGDSPSPIVFGMTPNWRTFRTPFGQHPIFHFARRSRFPHDPELLCEERLVKLLTKRVRGVRKAAVPVRG